MFPFDDVGMMLFLSVKLLIIIIQHWQQISIVWRQTIIGTNDGLYYWRIWSSCFGVVSIAIVYTLSEIIWIDCYWRRRLLSSWSTQNRWNTELYFSAGANFNSSNWHWLVVIGKNLYLWKTTLLLKMTWHKIGPSKIIIFHSVILQDMAFQMIPNIV